MDEDGLITRAIALHAASQAWAGISAISDRDGSILKSAERFEAWLLRESV